MFAKLHGVLRGGACVTSDVARQTGAGQQQNERNERQNYHSDVSLKAVTNG